MTVPIQSYAQVADLPLSGLPTAYFTGDLAQNTDQQQTFLNQTAAIMDGYMSSNSSVTLPLSPPYDPQLIACNVKLARFEMIQQRGYNPESPDVGLKISADTAMKWLRDLGENRVSLTRQATAPNPKGVQPQMISSRPRGLRNFSGGTGGFGR